MTGHVSYYPEMGQEKPEAQIEASLGHYGRHWFLNTPLVLSGRGIKHIGEHTAANNIGIRRIGWHRYKVTEAAFEKLSQQYRIVSETLL